MDLVFEGLKSVRFDKDGSKKKILVSRSHIGERKEISLIKVHLL